MTEARKLAVSIIVVVAVLAGACTWLVLGMRQTGSIEKSIDLKRKELTTIQEKISSVPALRQERQKLTGELDEYETILPNDREINKILDTLSEFQKKSGLSIRQFTPVRERVDNKPQTASYKKVAYDLDLSGDYFSLIRFLNLLENHNRFIQVDSLVVKQKDETSVINEITLKLSTFIYDPKVKAAAAATSKPGKAAAASAAKKAAARKGAPEVPFDLKRELSARYVYAASTTMRDPFANPLTRRVEAPPVAVNKQPDVPAPVAMTPEQERVEVEAAAKKLADAEPLIAQGNLDEAVKLLGECSIVRSKSFRDASTTERALGLSREWQRLDLMVRTAQGERLYRSAEETYEKMVTAFDDGDYDEVVRLRATLNPLLGIRSLAPAADRKGASKTPKPAPAVNANAAPVAVAEGEAIHERLVELVKACDSLVARAAVRREFAAVGVKIQGTFWSGTGDNRRAAAIINGKTVSEGDVLKRDARAMVKSAKAAPGKADAEIIVKKIDREKVIFSYKDELIEMTPYQLQ